MTLSTLTILSISIASYFIKLCLPLPTATVSQEDLNQYFKTFMISKTKDGSTQSAEVRVEIHHIMRSASERIHAILREF